jgi:hypothetical protein
MKQVGIVILMSVIASAAATAATPRQSGVTLLTQKSLDQFGGCFVAAQDRADLAWSFVPKADGGTFSNAGARGARSYYFLAVSDRGMSRQVRLEPAEAGLPIDLRIVRAVNQCA